ncbi:Por secretion system C-terminal sorting domain-containing protein [Dyadobacter soli]|uniref:Por secretion system C-terminal sorting domain-containing protein n=1 Tax=Dyadobacter soli TaxID=659014 RepID=A0A1G6XYF6_9BACT|nr:T9SS type A sorting domain-containing protein [Dyadobacter soli]SDD83254.1 Por secretion system C-terminal sorting domain-containing protein [Dyadobacter soli]
MHSFFTPLRKPFLFLFALIFSTSLSFGQAWHPGKKIVASDRTTLGAFGNAVSVSGNYAVIGAFDDDGSGDGKTVLASAGAAYLFYNDNGTWVQVKKIYPPTRARGDFFGRSVCIKDDYMIIGSECQTDVNDQNPIQGAGAAYLYAKDQGGPGNWGFVKKITSPNRQYREYFGSDAAIEGDHIVAGAYYEARTYVLEKNAGGVNNWGVVATLFPQAGNSFNSFGGRVAISGEYVVVSAYSDDNSGTGPALQHSGSAYIFKQGQGGTNNWGLVKKITAPVIMESATFGSAISIDGDHLVVGAPNEMIKTESTTEYVVGAAYLFSKNNGGADQWGLQKKLTADLRLRASFGASVAIKGSSIAVGGYAENLDYKNENPVETAGAAWVFSENRGGIGNWGQTSKITAPDRHEGEVFGNAIALNETQIIVGSQSERDGAPYSLTSPGAAYSFSLEAALPVTLARFGARKLENQAELSWTTTEETNSSHFEIQRSADGRNWVTLQNIPAANESHVVKPYNASDKAPLAGLNLYRLKMVDNDGTFAFSKIEALTFDGVQNALFYPNPATDRLQLSNALLKNTASLKLLDQTGKSVFETSRPTAIIQTGHISAGLYILQITRKDGTVTSSLVAIDN